MAAIHAGNVIAVSIMLFGVRFWIKGLQSVSVENTDLLFGSGERFLTLPQQCDTTLVGIKRLLQGHLTCFHGGHDALKLGESCFE
jgi:hypothetical protein